MPGNLRLELRLFPAGRDVVRVRDEAE